MAPTELPFSLKGRRVWVAGHRGMVGSALLRRLARDRLRRAAVGSDRSTSGARPKSNIGCGRKRPGCHLHGRRRGSAESS